MYNLKDPELSQFGKSRMKYVNFSVCFESISV